MIDPKLFTVERLLQTMLDHSFGNINYWRSLAEIIPDYVAPFAPEGTKPKCVVRVPGLNVEGPSFLRHSKGPMQGHSWDMYGDDYQTPELALLALMEAPIPPCYIDKDVWQRAHDAWEKKQ